MHKKLLFVYSNYRLNGIHIRLDRVQAKKIKLFLVVSYTKRKLKIISDCTMSKKMIIIRSSIDRFNNYLYSIRPWAKKILDY